MRVRNDKRVCSVKKSMESAIEIWSFRCASCSQVIGDVGRKYKALVAQGLSGFEAARSLGLYKACCLIELNSPTLYTTSAPFQTGRIKDTVLNPKLPIQVYALRKDENAQINVNLYKEPEPLVTKAVTISPEEAALQGITEPKVAETHDIRRMRSGEVAITGYQLDDNGNPVLIHVGMGMHVPVLTYIYKL